MKRHIRILIDVCLVLCLLAIVLITLSGGYRGEVLGLSISASSPFGAIRLILLLLLLRAAVALKGAELTLMLVSLLVALVLAELALRFWDAPITRHQLVQIHRASSVSGWELIPGASGVGNTGALYRINSVGCRDREYSVNKTPGTLRMVVLGDSFTFGMGVDLEHSYAKQLERLLQERGDRVEVINCGVIGHNMWQHRATLESRAWGYGPDLVVLGLYQDDLQASVPPAETREPGYAGHNPFAKTGASHWRHKSRLYNTLRNLEDLLKYHFRSHFGADHVRSIDERRMAIESGNANGLYYRIMSGQLAPGRYAQFQPALGEFAASVQKRGARLLVVLIPDAVQLNEPRLQESNRVIAAAATAIGVPFVDLTGLLERQPHPEDLYLFPDDAHNNPRGLGVIAAGIAESLKRHGLLPTNDRDI